MFKDVKIEKLGNDFIIRVDGKLRRREELSKEIGISYINFCKSFRLRKTVQEKEEWLKERFWLKDNKLGPKSKIFKRDGIWIAGSQIQAATGISRWKALQKGENWETGKISYEKMMEKSPDADIRNPLGEADWGGLTCKKRPNPEFKVGTWEKKNLDPKSVSGGVTSMPTEVGSDYYRGPVY